MHNSTWLTFPEFFVWYNEGSQYFDLDSAEFRACHVEQVHDYCTTLADTITASESDANGGNLTVCCPRFILGRWEDDQEQEPCREMMSKRFGVVKLAWLQSVCEAEVALYLED